MMESKNVYQAIAAVQGELAKIGISKDRVNEQQRYRFRGIDDVYNALAPLLSKHGLVIIPRMTRRKVVERDTAKGGKLFFVTVKAEFDFVSASDGSKHVAEIYGEAMDSADKATNKAMSAAYKYACFQVFAIPTEGDNDSESTYEPAQIISEGQLAELRTLIDDTSSDEAAFCKYLKIAALEVMPAQVFGNARALLMNKKRNAK